MSSVVSNGEQQSWHEDSPTLSHMKIRCYREHCSASQSGHGGSYGPCPWICSYVKSSTWSFSYPQGKVISGRKVISVVTPQAEASSAMGYHAFLRHLEFDLSLRPAGAQGIKEGFKM